MVTHLTRITTRQLLQLLAARLQTASPDRQAGIIVWLIQALDDPDNWDYTSLLNNLQSDIANRLETGLW